MGIILVTFNLMENARSQKTPLRAQKKDEEVDLTKKGFL